MSASVTIWVDGARREVPPGRSLAAALLASSPVLRRWEGGARGLFCGMGSCLDCRVVVDGATRLACLTQVRDGMRVATRPEEGDA